MSPEQARGDVVEARSDIFSFGTMLYEMVTGRLPFAGRTNTDILSAILRDEPTPVTALDPGVPAELQRISDDATLAVVIATDQKGSKSRFVIEQIAFARACLSLVRGEAEWARATLEPLAKVTEIPGYHHVLARTYEALEMWRAAATEYEDVLRPLDKFRLARAYDRLADAASARQRYERFLPDWKDADNDIPELAQAKARLAALSATPGAAK